MSAPDLGADPGPSEARIGEAVAHPNLALVKYWGKRDRSLNLPATGSISISMGAFTTRTWVKFGDERGRVEVIVNGEAADGGTATRINDFLDLVRTEAGLDGKRALVRSDNDFPTAAGLASSSSAFAALGLAACEAAGLNPTTSELSLLSRRGSGSAARSIFGGYVEMRLGNRSDGQDAVAAPLAPSEHWDLRIVIAVTDPRPKRVGSTEGMELTRKTSPYYPAWVETSSDDLRRARDAVKNRDLSALGEVAEHSALKMHACALASQPGLLYWRGGTVEAMHAVREMRSAGHAAWFTVDAGPHVKVLCGPDDVEALEGRLRCIPGVSDVLVSDVGAAARLIDPPSEA